MSEYEEALENIIVYPLKEECEHSPCCECNNQCSFYKMKLHDYDILKELVKIATPRKPINIEVRSGFLVVGQCPRCRCSTTNQNAPFGAYEGIEFCSNCGQAIDWSDYLYQRRRCLKK